MQLSVYRSSAGSGKTFTLVKDFLRIALSSSKPEKVKHILALTFTNKAAQEMKERILSSLEAFSSNEELSSKERALLDEILASESFNVSEKETRKRAKNLLLYVLHNYAHFSVSTIDKFNYQLIQTFAQDLGLSSNAEVELEELEVLEEAVDALFSTSNNNELLSKWLNDFLMIQLEEDKSWNIKRHFVEFSKITLNENDQFLIDQLGSLELSDFQKSLETIRVQIGKIESTITSLGKKGFDLLSENEVDPTSFFNGKNSVLLFLNRLTHVKINEFPNKGILNMLERDDWSKSTASKTQKEQIESIKEDLRNFIESTLSSAEPLIEKWIILKAILKNIHGLGLLLEVRKNFLEIAEQRNSLPISTFNKLISGVIRNEPAPFIYERLGNRYQNFLIDEFQDTSKMQWQNLLPLLENGLATQSKSLIVGDAKQAIYRWRGGDADQFVYLPKITDPNADAVTIDRGKVLEQYVQELTLDANWRSSPEIVNFNNDFFSKLANRKDGLIKDVYKSVKQIPKKEDTPGYVQYSLVPAESDETKQTQDEQMLNRVFESIETLLDSGYRKGDIAILCRSNNQISALSKYLEPKIEIVTSEGLLLFSHPSSLLLQTALDYMLLINSTEREIQRTNLGVNVLYLLYQMGRIPTDPHLLFESAAKNGSVSNMKLILQSLGIDFEIEQLLPQNIYQQLVGLTRIFQLSKNPSPYVILLLEKALDYSKKYPAKTSFHFSEWIKSKAEKLSIALPESPNAIRIMTIHKAKGLEFPAVIFPYANSLIKSDAKFWIDTQHLDIGLPFGLINANKLLEKTKYASIYETEQLKSWLDTINMYYVAFTRAENALFIIAHEYKKSNSDMRSFYQPILEEYSAFDTEKVSLKLGNLVAPKRTEEPAPKKIEVLPIVELNTENWLDNIKIAPTSKTQDEPAANYGEIVHNILKKITPDGFSEATIDELSEGRDIDDATKQKIKSQLKNLFQFSDFVELFNSSGKRFAEREISTSTGQILRPDLVIVRDVDAILIDYKTGVHELEHEQQILQYKSVLEEFLSIPVLPYLVYTEQLEVLKVN